MIFSKGAPSTLKSANYIMLFMVVLRFYIESYQPSEQQGLLPVPIHNKMRQ